MHNALIIDRIKMNHNKIKQYIKDSGLEIKVIASVTTAEEAESIINESNIDLVIAEDLLPDKTSLQLYTDSLEAHPHLHMIIIAEYNQFNTSREAMAGGQLDFLFKPVRKNDVIKSLIQMNHLINATKERKYKQERLRNDYELSKGVFKDRFLINLIHGHIKNDLQIMDQFDYFDIVHNNSFVVGVMKIDQYKKYQLALDTDEAQFLIFRAQDVIKSYLKVNQLGFCFINRFDEICFIITKEIDDETLMDHCYNMLERLVEGANLRGTIGLGNTYKQPTLISISYNQARAALGFSFYLGNGSVIPIDFISKDSNLAYSYPRSMEHKMIELIANGDTESAKKLLTNMFNALYLVKTLPDNYISLLVIDVMVSINRVSSENSTPIKGFFKDYIRLQEINELSTLEEAHDYLQKAFKDIGEYQKQKRQEMDEMLLEKVTKYVTTYYANRISLKRAAEYLKTTPSHLESLIFNRYDKSFFDYCMMIRLNMAKELLGETDYTTTEVATKIGFSSAEYFAAIFRQHIHMSPSQYRHQTKLS